MDVFQEIKDKASKAFPDMKLVGGRISSSLQESLDFSLSPTISSRWSKSDRRQDFRRRAESYDEYYFRNSNIRLANKRKEGKLSPLINKFDRLDHNLTPKQITEKSRSPLHCYSQSPKARLPSSSSVLSYNSDFNQTLPKRRDISISSCDSGFMDSSMPAECYFLGHKDSIADVDLDLDQVQITVNHVHKNNLLCVSIHRATLTFPKFGRIYAKLCLLPNKLQKKKGKLIELAKAKRWEEDFVFSKLSIGQLETSSIQIKIYQENGFLKRPFLKYEAVVALKDVDITDFQTTVLPLTTVTNQLTLTHP